LVEPNSFVSDQSDPSILLAFARFAKRQDPQNQELAKGMGKDKLTSVDFARLLSGPTREGIQRKERRRSSSES